jgi:uncharacterized protein YfaS (alpha-2-macroglobulin family)
MLRLNKGASVWIGLLSLAVVLAIGQGPHGTWRVALPYTAPHAGAGRLSMEVLNPEDRVVGRSEQAVTVVAGKGVWQQELSLTKTLAMDDLVWHRLRYRFVYAGENTLAIEGIESISEILRTPVLHIIGQSSYLAGGEAAVRVVVSDSKNEPIPGRGTLQIELLSNGQKASSLFQGSLNERGTTQARFQVPAGMAGNLALRYVAETQIGSSEFVEPVRMEDKVSILLTTEKPIYQPGQTIHARALALDRAQHNARAEAPLTFELEDSRGNKVFKKATQTDQFGIASAEFALADEVNLGAYHLRAVMNQTHSEIAVNVDRYVLPKFKVAVDFTGKAKHGYRPGDRVTGTVRANYFFGKPVETAEVTVKASGMDVAQFEAGSVQGKTDRDGAYTFDLKLPAYFAGRPLNQGAARVLVEATVKDSAGHSETRGEPVTVSESPLIVTAVPEGGTLAPDLDNQVFVLTSYADGKPAVTSVHAADQTVATDAGGIAIIHVKAGDAAQVLRIDASDREGNRESATVRLNVREGSEQILLRTARAVYRAGDQISLQVFSTKQRGTAYIDVVREGQTVLTRDLDIVNGQAQLSLAATPDLAGTLDINAYLFGADARPVGDHRLVFVQPADELKIEATSDAAVYKPGDDARINFRVTNSKGEGVAAALGLQVVDEAVFALAEKQPGFAKVFFYLEQEAMKPRYEIHSIGMAEAIAQDGRAAKALFAATEMVNPNRFETEYGRTVPMAKFADYAQRYQERLTANLKTAIVAMPQPGEMDVRDPWGTKVRVERPQWQAGSGMFLVRSAGPDKRFDTVDDSSVLLQIRSSAEFESIDIQVEHDRGPNNGMAEIAGQAVAGTSIRARELATGKMRRAICDAQGGFLFSALPVGEYEVRVMQNSRKFTLEARDRAVVTVHVRQTAVEAVEVVNRVRVGGVAGGVIGGVLGQVKFMRMEQMAVDAAAPMAKFKVADSPMLGTGTIPVDAPRVRSYFPEALYINPEIITDKNGLASISVPLADSITTWRMAMMASTVHGALGSGTSSLKVFQDFFVDLDLPVTLTQGDRVSIPVAAYNYSGAKGDVSLSLHPDHWFTLVDDAAEKTVAVEPGRVGGAQFTLEAKRIGKFKLTLAARMTGGSDRADIVIREIEVVPNGREQSQVFNGRLESTVQHAVNFPPASIPDASAILVRLYPGPLSQVIEGMDAILRMPGGCFEQTSSSTYPNVLALDYMKRTKKLTPEVHAKAEGFIANGYQRLLTFEVPGGGFSWFGSAPANKILTSYGLMEFSDMAKVYDVDPRLIERTQSWLANQQQPDGSWKPDTGFINEGATNRYNSDVLRITGYIAWSLENTGYRGPAVAKAREYVRGHLDGKVDTYTLAVLANFAVDGNDRDFTRQAMQRLVDARTEKDDKILWSAEETAVYATGDSASVETTGLAVQALLKWGEASGTAMKALSYLASKKDASGTWGTTQATIMALRAVLLSTEKGSADVRGTVELTLNGKAVQKLTLTPDNNDLLHQFVFKQIDTKGANSVGLRFSGKGGLAYQVVGRYFLPWTEKPVGEPLSIDVAYDRTQLAQNDVASATATVRNNLGKSANMVMIDLGIPPGFDLLSEDLQAMQEQTAGRKGGRLEKFSLTAKQAILYFDSIGAGETVTVRYRLRAKYPIRVRTFASRAYEYYDPTVSSMARPVTMEVRR